LRRSSTSLLREPVAVLLLWAAAVAWMFLFAYALAGNPGRILGLPAWLFCSTVLPVALVPLVGGSPSRFSSEGGARKRRVPRRGGIDEVGSPGSWGSRRGRVGPLRMLRCGSGVDGLLLEGAFGGPLGFGQVFRIGLQLPAPLLVLGVVASRVKRLSRAAGETSALGLLCRRYEGPLAPLLLIVPFVALSVGLLASYARIAVGS